MSKGTQRLSVFWGNWGPFALIFSAISAEPWFAGLQAKRVWGVSDFSVEGWWGQCSRCEHTPLFSPGQLGNSPASLSAFRTKSSKLTGGFWVFFLSHAHTRLDVHRVLECEIPYFWNGLLKATGGFNYMSSPATATVLQLWPRQAIPLLSALKYWPWAVPKASQSKRDARK